MPLRQMQNDITYFQQLSTVQAGGGLQQLHSADDVATERLINALNNSNNNCV